MVRRRAMSSKPSTGCDTSRRIGGLMLLVSSMFGLGPMKDTSDITIASRIGSIGGVGRCSENCLKLGLSVFVFLVQMNGQGLVIPNGADGFFAAGCHWRQDDLDVFLGVAEQLLAVQQR